MYRSFFIISVVSVSTIGSTPLLETELSEFKGPCPVSAPLNFTSYYPSDLNILGFTNEYAINHLFTDVIPDEALPNANVSFKIFYGNYDREMVFQIRNFTKILRNQTNDMLTFTAILSNLNCKYYTFDQVHLWMVNDFLVIWVCSGDSKVHHTENIFLIYIDINEYSPAGFIKTQVHGILQILYPDEAHLSNSVLINFEKYPRYIKTGYCPTDVMLVVKFIFIYVLILIGIGLLLCCKGCRRSRQGRVVAWVP